MHFTTDNLWIGQRINFCQTGKNKADALYLGLNFILMEVYEMNNKYLDCIALTIAIIGAVNWGLIGFFSFDLVSFIFGNMSWISRIVYALVGICGLYLITFYMYAGGLSKNDQ